MVFAVPITPFDVNALLLHCMHLIESEALPVDVDYPTGLWWYVGHLDRDGEARKVNNTEVAWTQRLSEMFRSTGWDALSERRYPGETRDRCDVVVQWAHPKPWWIEVKGAWKTKFDSDLPNSAYQTPSCDGA